MIKILPISNEEAAKIVQKGIRSVSYSLITRAYNEQEVIDYVLRKEMVGIHFSYGTQAHAVIGNEDYQHQADVKSYIDDKNQVFLSYHQISETMLMKLAIEKHRHYKLKHLNRLTYEKKFYCIICYEGYKFLCKAYIDAYNSVLNTILEFKTTSSAFNIGQTIDKYNYDLQACIYQNIILAHYNLSPEVEFFFLNKQDNHDVCYVHAAKSIITAGKNKFYNMFPRIVDILVKHKYINLFTF